MEKEMNKPRKHQYLFILDTVYNLEFCKKEGKVPKNSHYEVCTKNKISFIEAVKRSKNVCVKPCCLL